MSPRLPEYPKQILRAGREALKWPRPERAPGFYEFESELNYATDIHNMVDAGVKKYAEDNDIPIGIAIQMLDVQVEDATERVLAFTRQVWGE